MTFEIILEVLPVLASSIILGEAFEQLGLPSVAGQLLSGMILGPTIVGLIAPDPELQGVASVSLFFIIFMIGLEMNTKTLGKHVSQGTLLTLTSFIVPFVLCLGVGLVVFPFATITVFIVALAVSVPSISIISVLVMQYKMLEEASGLIILATVTITDIVAFVILAAASGPVVATLRVITETGIFVAAFLVVDWSLNHEPALIRSALVRVGRLAKSDRISYAALILVGLTVAAIFQTIGLSYIIGAFFAGLIVHDGLIGRKPFKEVPETFARINGAFFIPFFFGFAGVEADLTAPGLRLIPALAVVLAVSLGLGISLTYYVTKRLFKLHGAGAAKQVAVTLGGRGAVGIVIASVALSTNVIDVTAYSLILVSTVAASLIVSLLLGRRG
jgi:Kef-type K+ transport system membrane component KefB